MSDKQSDPPRDALSDTESNTPGQPSRWTSVFGGPNTPIGPRIIPMRPLGFDPHNASSDTLASGSDDSGSALMKKQRDDEKDDVIKYRTCSWQKTSFLLFSEYICLAIMSFPWSYHLLGLVPGLILTAVIAALVLYTSLILWKFCLRHPEVRDVCDIGQALFWNKQWAWWATAVMFLLNNTFIQGLHVLIGAEYINTMSDGAYVSGCRTVEFAAAVTVVCWLASLPRTFNVLAVIAAFSAVFTFISVMLALAFSVQQGKPAGYSAEKGEPIVNAFTPGSTTFVTGMAAFLNISYTFIGQITIPSFIAEMKEPRDFPKALWACTVAEIFVFSIVGAVIYAYTGNQYMTTPAFGSLVSPYKEIAFSFMVPTLIFLGVLYASVTARFIFLRWFAGTRHVKDHTVKGWFWWTAILLGTWIMAFIISQVIPFFSSLLSVMSSLFDCWFGFIFWGVAYFRMRKVDAEHGRKRNPLGDKLGVALNAVIIAIGFYFLTAGTYASVQGIMDEFAAGTVAGVFSCKSNAI